MTTLISLILIPLDLIAADWTIKWAKMSRRRSGNVWATTTEGRAVSGGRGCVELQSWRRA